MHSTRKVLGTGQVLMLLTSLFALAPKVAHAQSEPVPSLHHAMTMNTGTSQIDGSEHPELIPDNTAFRLVFVLLSQPTMPNAPQRDTPDDAAIRAATQVLHLRGTGLRTSDLQTISAELEQFRTAYALIIRDYNDFEVPALLDGRLPDYVDFLRKRDALVDNTLNHLRRTLSAAAFENLQAFVQSEKSKMRISR